MMVGILLTLLISFTWMWAKIIKMEGLLEKMEVNLKSLDGIEVTLQNLNNHVLKIQHVPVKNPPPPPKALPECLKKSIPAYPEQNDMSTASSSTSSGMRHQSFHRTIPGAWITPFGECFHMKSCVYVSHGTGKARKIRPCSGCLAQFLPLDGN